MSSRARYQIPRIQTILKEKKKGKFIQNTLKRIPSWIK